MDLLTRQGALQVRLTPETEIWRQMEGSGSQEDLARGQIVPIFGQRGDGGQQLEADLIVILPPTAEGGIDQNQPLPQP